ncbi:MAG: hypothetical protein COY66_04840 [Candidatus Kerfeldbacteria bacterium CG_4_10_14_0_8_um_filter_42_10]|uniref:YoaR-like putative peptidoglycan binding domain-containing protein n=1 Tax=Candidatus Kerfeldbacteria bacterium CG_4_10_14_0_8_um_filter_42_10 TaxID=2014248 RepID=A0A2M7RHX6_9BACT|nr:MAG: hypothetical protein COY66_04840 [Candidatus Kerfeldbacteria bacterium CG_4_10_14_0_8_um_filter_42_10]
MPKAKKKSKPAPKKKTERHLLAIIIIGIFVVLIIGGAVLIYPNYYHNKVFPGIKVGSIDLSGKTYLEALDLIDSPINSFNKEGLVFTYQEEKVALQPTLVGTDIGSSYEILTFDSNATIQEAYSFGRRGNYWSNFKEQLAALIYGQPINLNYYFNAKEVENSLIQNYSQFEFPHKDASLNFNQNAFSIIPEEQGRIFDYQTIVNEMADNVRNLEFQPVYLELEPDPPQITENQAVSLLIQAEAIADFAPLTVRYGEQNWEINKETFSDWLDFRFTDSNSTSQNEIWVGLNPERAGDYLESLREKIDVPVKEGKFKIEEGKVTQFQASQPGISLAILSSVQALESNFIKGNKKEAELMVQEEQPEITTENINNLGIRELIGTGKSDFSGSPRNRRANIQLGADKLNGILIKPEEEFSLLKALGKFEASEGWLPELVIKGNKTVPELGGGACQFGTTMFRAALDTGLPVTSRRNHSYTVSYYYPIGTDATIYDPAPDLKFINDTKNYILLQTKIEGNELIFEMWGTKDGRIVEKTDPRLSGWQSPPPTKTIETEDLAPGQVKCTERAHQGVSAEFDYKVTYSDGEVKEETFQSKYKPWQEVCLLGVEKKTIESPPTSVE